MRQFMGASTPASAQSELLIGDVFRDGAQSVPNRVAAELGDRPLTFGEIDRSSNRLGRGLRDLGVAIGDRIAVVGSANLSLVPLFAATAKLGAVYSPIEPDLEPSTLLDLLQIVRPAVVVIDDEAATSSKELTAELGVPAVSLARLLRSSAGDDDSDLPVAGPTELDAQAIFLSSTGGGRPKGVIVSHRVQFLRTQLGALEGRRGTEVCAYPLTDPIAWEIGLRQWQARSCVVVVDPNHPAGLLEAVARHSASGVTVTPSLLREVIGTTASGREAALQLSSLRQIDVVGAALPGELVDKVASMLPEARLRLVYRCTEAGPIAYLEGPDLQTNVGSCGIPGPVARLAIERTGELCVRGPLLFDGYFDDSEATSAAVVDGWYHTGDVAEIDGEGYLTILGEIRDIIRTASGGVVPIEVETAIAGHVAVGDVAVVGMADGAGTQSVCAVVVPAAGQEPPSLSDLRSFCENRIDSLKLPSRLIVVPTIPRTEKTNQVKRPLLREQLALLA